MIPKPRVVGASEFVVEADPATEAKQDVGNTSLASIDGKLPAAGLATEAKQDTGNTSVASIDTKTPALGQALAASSVPVVLTAAQLSTLTPPAAITGFATLAEQQTQTTHLANIAGEDFATQTTLALIKAKTDNLDVLLSTLTTPADTQPVSAASLPLPTGASTAANQSTANTALAAIQTAIEILDNIVSGAEAQVDIVAPLPAGTNAIGKLAANSGVDIGDVDILSIAAGDNNIGNVDIVTMPTVTVTATNLDIRDLSSVSDSVSAVQSGTWILGANSGVDIGDVTINNATLAVTQSGTWNIGTVTTVTAVTAITNALPAGTNAIGKLAANSGVDIGDVDILSIAAGDNNIGNVDIASALPTGTNAIGRVGHDVTGIGHGVKTVTTAGTDVALAASTACKKVDIQAQTDNTGYIAVGASGVDATVATGSGILLGAGDVFSLEIDNLADVFIDSTVNGEGVRFTYFS